MPGGDDFEVDPRVIEVVDATNASGEPNDAITIRSARTDWWRTSRGQYLIAAVVLVVAVIVAYQLGTKAENAPPKSLPSAPAPEVSSAAAVSSPALDRTPAVAETGQLCATQIGRQLQLGLQVVNQSTATLTLMTLTANLPIGGFRAATQATGSCGQLTLTAPVAGTELAPGATTWTTMTFDVLEDCPTPYPVQFTFVIAQGDQSSTVTLGGFADLSGVSYSGCAEAS